MISSKIEEDYVEVCEKAAAIGEIKKWISKDTWEAIVQRTEEKIQAEEVNRNCRRDNRVYVGSEVGCADDAKRNGEVEALYESKRKFSGSGFENTFEPVRNEAGVLFRTADKEIYRGMEYFERVLNYKEPPNSLQVDQGNEILLDLFNLCNREEERGLYINECQQ